MAWNSFYLFSFFSSLETRERDLCWFPPPSPPTANTSIYRTLDSLCSTFSHRDLETAQIKMNDFY